MESPRSDDRSALISRAVKIESPAFRAAYEALSGRRFVWATPDGSMMLGGGAAATVTATGSGRFSEVKTAAESLFASSDVRVETKTAVPRLFGGFAFHAASGEKSQWDGFPDAEFVLPDVQLTYSDNTTWLTVNATGLDATVSGVEDRLRAERDRLAGLVAEAAPDRPGIGSIDRTTDRAAWRETVSEATSRISAGELDKVVLAQSLDADLNRETDVATTLERLRRRYPDCYVFCADPIRTDATFVGATPERLVSARGRSVETSALAGTTGRGETPAEDEWLAAELREDEKNRHEHELVVKAIQRQVAPFAASVSTGDLDIRRLATVQHLQTPISVDLSSEEHVLTLAEALHPTPAVGGLPPEAALATIRETESFDRGWYAAPIGCIDAAGGGDFAVALRSALLTPQNATLFAGVGIVADSDPAREWNEIELKYRPILDALDSASPN
jgi:isochorismate synthases